jgi:hypothetical protein
MKIISRGLLAVASVLYGITIISCTTTIRPDLYGTPVPQENAARTVIILPSTKLVTVKDYETVKFVTGQRSFAWRFDPAPRLDQLYLHWIAPENMVAHDILVIVTTDPAKTDR